MNRDEYRFFRGVESYLLRILWLASGRRAPRATLIMPPAASAAPEAAESDQRKFFDRSARIAARAVHIVLSALFRTLIPGTILGLFLVFGVLRNVPVERFGEWPFYTAGAVLSCVVILLAVHQALKERNSDRSADVDEVVESS